MFPHGSTQIRKHLSGLNHPILNDATHGDSKVNRWWRSEMGLHHLGLHCAETTLTLPCGQVLHVKCPPRRDLVSVWRRLPWWDDALTVLPLLGEDDPWTEESALALEALLGAEKEERGRGRRGGPSAAVRAWPTRFSTRVGLVVWVQGWPNVDEGVPHRVVERRHVRSESKGDETCRLKLEPLRRGGLVGEGGGEGGGEGMMDGSEADGCSDSAWVPLSRLMPLEARFKESWAQAEVEVERGEPALREALLEAARTQWLAIPEQRRPLIQDLLSGLIGDGTVELGSNDWDRLSGPQYQESTK